ncbi:MAG TPA: flagellar motor protein MotB [Chloroflexota bacterium]|nr:flagellar motor protein MotB [Chloroflexota bacterium]
MASQAVPDRKHRVKPKKENSERWLLTYSDMMTLLLAFFVIMYGMSNADAAKFERLASGMKKAFNVGILTGSPDAAMMEQTMDLIDSSGGADQTAVEGKDMEMIFSEMGWALDDEALSDKVSVNVRPEGIAISLSGNLLFSSGRAELRPDAVKLLHSLGRVLSRVPNSVRIEGHTDDIAPSGTGYPTNWELSGARAVAVVRYFTEMEGINPQRLSAVAYSQYQPVSANDSARSRARNRRSEILILYPPSQTTARAAAAERTPTGGPGSVASSERESNSAVATR